MILLLIPLVSNLIGPVVAGSEYRRPHEDLTAQPDRPRVSRWQPVHYKAVGINMIIFETDTGHLAIMEEPQSGRSQTSPYRPR